jgi:hypothetical protein
VRRGSAPAKLGLRGLHELRCHGSHSYRAPSPWRSNYSTPWHQLSTRRRVLELRMNMVACNGTFTRGLLRLSWATSSRFVASLDSQERGRRARARDRPRCPARPSRRYYIWLTGAGVGTNVTLRGSSRDRSGAGGRCDLSPTLRPRATSHRPQDERCIEAGSEIWRSNAARAAIGWQCADRLASSENQPL